MVATHPLDTPPLSLHQNRRERKPPRAFFTDWASRASQRAIVPTEATMRSFATSSRPVCASENWTQSPTVSPLGRGAPSTGFAQSFTSSEHPTALAGMITGPPAQAPKPSVVDTRSNLDVRAFSIAYLLSVLDG